MLVPRLPVPGRPTYRQHRGARVLPVVNGEDGRETTETRRQGEDWTLYTRRYAWSRNLRKSEELSICCLSCSMGCERLELEMNGAKRFS